MTPDQLTTLLTFAGIRPSDQTILQDGAAIMAIRPYQNATLSALLGAYEHGAVDDSDFNNELATMNLPADAETWITTTAKYRKIEQLLTLLRRSNSEGYQYGQVLDTDYVGNLTGAGMDSAHAEAFYAIDSARKIGRASASAAKSAMAETARVRRESIAAADKQYLSGVYGPPMLLGSVTPGAGGTSTGRGPAEVALLAAVIAAGLDVYQAALHVYTMQLRASGSFVKVYNLYVSHYDAVLLKSKVAAIREQAVKKAIDSPTELAQLEALGLSPAWAQAMTAKDAAQALKVVLPI